jgi:xylulokinase
MSQSNYIIAHDLGTTGNKATLFDAVGSTVATAFEAYDTAYLRPNWAEQDPADWQRAIFRCTRRLLAQSSVEPGDIAAVSFSGHMQGAVVVNREGIPLCPAIIWADQRATAQADFVRRACGEENIYRLTGHRISAAYTAAKVLWIKDNQPGIYRQIHKVLQAKDYVAFLLTGVFATDYSDASGTQVFELESRRWADEVLNALGLDPDLFPTVYPSSTVIGGVTVEAAASTGLLAGTPVVIGGGDGACATVGAGSVQVGDAYTNVGSSAWIALTTRHPIFDPQRRTFTFAHLDPELYFPIGTMQSAGGSYAWLESLLRAGKDEATLYNAMDTQAATVPPGARGLLFLPYLLGERSPYWNPLARAAFVGLAMSHSRAELSRAVLEGVALNLRLILDALRVQGVRVEAMRLIGGGAQSKLWRQILADVYGLPVLLPTLTAEASALGAAIAGGVGVGLFPDFSVATRLIPAAEAERPNPAHVGRYTALYGLFKETYVALEPIFAQLALLTT